MERFTIYAGPVHKWGPEHIFRPLSCEGPRTLELEFYTILSAPSAGEVVLQYWDRSGHRDDHVVIPGKTIINVGDCLCPVYMRAKSYSTGQAIEVTVYSWPSQS